MAAIWMGEMTVKGELWTGAPDIRRSERLPVALDGTFRERGMRGESVDIMNLSLEGFRCSWHWQLKPDDAIWLKLPGLEALPARVIWSENFTIGAEFEAPLHPAVFNRLTTPL